MEDQPKKAALGRGRGFRARMRTPSPGRGLSLSSSSSSASPPASHIPLSSSGSSKTSPPRSEDIQEEIAEEMGSLAVRDGGSSEKQLGESCRGFKRGTAVSRYEPYIMTRPSGDFIKTGKNGKEIELTVNYYRLEKATNWTLYQYDVIIEPEMDHLGTKKSLVWQNKEKIGAYIYDGVRQLYSAVNCGEILKLEGVTKEGETHNVTLRMVKELEPGNPTFLQFYNIIMKKILAALKLEPLGRGYYDSTKAIEIKSAGLTLWPGFITSIRNHENDLKLCVEVTHKVLRTENVFEVIKKIRNDHSGGGDGWKKAVEAEIIGSIVLTVYNHKTYAIQAILWDEKPTDSFERKQGPTTFLDYFKTSHKVDILSQKQPLLLAVLKKRDEEMGLKPAKLVPELCQLTGLTDNMRSNFQLMKSLSTYLHQGPSARIKTIEGFRQSFETAEYVEVNRRTREELKRRPIAKELKDWGLVFAPKLSVCSGRAFDPENILFAGGKTENATVKADWTMGFRTKQMVTTIEMKNWVFLVPQRELTNVSNMISTMKKVATPLSMKINDPMKISTLQQAPNVNNYMRQIEDIMAEVKDKIQMLFVVLPNNKADLYGAVKKRLCIDYGVPSQCFLAKNLTAKGLMSIATKVVIQMNAKLGGIPWTIKIPLKKTMILGFDVYHGAKGVSKQSIGALVATTSEDFGNYFSTISYHQKDAELSKELCASMEKCLGAFRKKNGFLPEKIYLYRDGVGEGQMHVVFKTEVKAVDGFLKELYQREGVEYEPKLTFIVVTKKINTRMFKGKDQNPDPGTILDNTITLPERYDFFMVAQQARQGTVSPTSYNVLMDASKMDPGRLQQLSFKLCHLYYNWSGTVAVPAPCQYAHKLANLTGLAIGAPSSEQLADKLFFL